MGGYKTSIICLWLNEDALAEALLLMFNLSVVIIINAKTLTENYSRVGIHTCLFVPSIHVRVEVCGARICPLMNPSICRIFLCEGTIHKKWAGWGRRRAAVVQEEWLADGTGHGAGQHVGGHHALYRKPRPGASQRHATAALPLLSVSHSVFLTWDTYVTNSLICTVNDGMINMFSCLNVWLSEQGSTAGGGHWCTWIGMVLLNYTSCLVRWFLRKYPSNGGCSPTEKEAFEHSIGKAILHKHMLAHATSCTEHVLTCSRVN